MDETCRTYWGSHGCGLPAGHDPDEEHPVHECTYMLHDIDGNPYRERCCQTQYTSDITARVRYVDADVDSVEFGEWYDYGLPLFRMDEETPR